jgi:hypothetical protein
MLLVLILLVIVTYSCLYNETFYENLTRDKRSLEYIHDSDIIAGKKYVATNIESVNFDLSAMRDKAYIKEVELDLRSKLLGMMG